jgi:hypothetical protein
MEFIAFGSSAALAVPNNTEAEYRYFSIDFYINIWFAKGSPTTEHWLLIMSDHTNDHSFYFSSLKCLFWVK